MTFFLLRPTSQVADSFAVLFLYAEGLFSPNFFAIFAAVNDVFTTPVFVTIAFGMRLIVFLPTVALSVQRAPGELTSRTF